MPETFKQLDELLVTLGASVGRPRSRVFGTTGSSFWKRRSNWFSVSDSFFLICGISIPL
jgi:hypothetical protein